MKVWAFVKGLLTRLPKQLKSLSYFKTLCANELV